MTVTEQIQHYNEGRDPERLAIKYGKMTDSVLGFFRGSAHLFYDQLGELPDSPQGWLCGDLHLENFGSFRADNRLTYFDFNDFDEACRGPVLVDLARLLTSIVLEAREREYKRKQIEALVKAVVDSYGNALAAGKSRWLERGTANGLILDLLNSLGCRSSAKFLEGRTILDGRRRFLKADGKKALPADEKSRKALKRFVRRELPEVRFVDAARRIAGNGSLGLPRYALLVEDKSGAYLLLDLKRAQPCVILRRHDWPQPDWRNDAQRVVTVQSLMQAVPSAFLREVEFEGAHWILRELLPQEDRVDVAQASNLAFEEFCRTLGELVAWGVLRASGRHGSVSADELVEFGEARRWRTPLIECALENADVVLRDWREFVKAMGTRTSIPKPVGQ